MLLLFEKSGAAAPPHSFMQFMITPTQFESILHFGLGLCCFAAGFAVAVLMDAARGEE